MYNSFKSHPVTLCLSLPTAEKKEFKKNQTTYAVLRPLGNASNISTQSGRDACLLKAAMKAQSVMQILTIDSEQYFRMPRT